MKTWTVALLLFAAGAAAGQQAPSGNRGNNPGLRAAPTNFPTQQRTSFNAELVARGKTVYEINCRACHGVDLRGGDQGGPNLLRSQTALNDKSGELIAPVVREGRQTPGMSAMPPIPISADDVASVVEYIHSVLAATQRQGGPPPGPRPVLNVLVGDAAAGKSYFDAKCSVCHSAEGDLRSIGEKYPDPVQLQNSWLSGTRAGARGNNANPATVTVTPSVGSKVEGRLSRIDDFIVVMMLDDDTFRSFRRDGDNPKIEIHDPRDAHRNLLPQYTDKDIHDVTAYLVTLK